MSKVVVKYQRNEAFVNLQADFLRETEGMIYAFDGDNLVGVFDLGIVDMIYLSRGKDERKE